jgi:hypothetical protein
MKTIKVDYLARAEGEGAMHIRFRGDEVRDVAVRIFEPPRFFEVLLAQPLLHRSSRHHGAQPGYWAIRLILYAKGQSKVSVDLF